MLEFRIGAQLRREALTDDAPLAHDVDAVGVADRKSDLLFDQQNGYSLRLQILHQDAELRTINGASPSEGSSISSRSGLVTSAPRGREHLLLAATQLVGAVVHSLGEIREQVHHRRESHRPVAVRAATDRFSVRSERGRRGVLAGRSRCRFARSCAPAIGRWSDHEHDLSLARRRQSDHRAHQRGLSDAVPAQDRDDLSPAGPRG